ncbi:MAG: hypothetical protein CSYNP_03336 [Syntrophus sp. SKADARSKE-3]|nr:hypothetical protein [Syntrophus sp. SKADARSKE-3]
MIIQSYLCPKCNSWNVDKAEHKTILQKINVFIPRKELYACEDCGWHGYIIKVPLIPPAMSIALGIIVLVIIMVLIFG